MDLHALWQGALNVVERGIDSPGQLQGIHRGLLLDPEDDRGLRIVRTLSTFDRRAFTDDPHVADEDRHGVSGLDADGTNRIDAGKASDAANEVFLSLRDLKARRRVPVRGRQRLFHFRERHSMGGQTRRIEHDLVLLLVAAGGDYLRDARHCQQPAANDSFRDRPNLER